MADSVGIDDEKIDGLTRATAHGPKWTGAVRLVPEQLDQPLRWRKPRRIFVDSMSDLFHESVPDDYIDRAFAAMALSSRHTFQVLTKRAERMRAWFERWDDGRASMALFGARLPLPNVWLGVSCENQAAADERIPHLLATPAAVRFVSAEPLLGPVDLGDDGSFLYDARCACGRPGYPHARGCPLTAYAGAEKGLDWVIVGGESGPRARPCRVDWIRWIVEQCKAAAVPVFVKQLGAKPVVSEATLGEWGDGVRFAGHPQTGRGLAVLRDRKGGDPSEWPEDLRVREMPTR